MYEIVLNSPKIILQLPVKPRSVKVCSTWIRAYCRSQKNIHPGEILLEKFLKPMSIWHYRLAKDISVPAMRISKICNGRSGISADTVLRLACYFWTTVEFWTRIQTRYDTERVKMDIGEQLEK